MYTIDYGGIIPVPCGVYHGIVPLLCSILYSL